MARTSWLGQDVTSVYRQETNVNLSRRKFTALLGLAPAAAPLAAKAAADAGIGQLVGIRDLAPPVAYGAGGMSAPPSQLDDYARSQIAAADYVRMFGVPDFVKENTRRNCGYISALDPDIACKRSWSMSVKIATQRQRNYERSIEQMQHSAWHTKARAGFKTLAGFDWPW